MNLEPPASHHLSSAQGWLELGNAEEADAELRQIHARFQSHPDVMELRWQTLAQLKRWRECVTLAEELVEMAANKSSGWVHRAYALHEMGDTKAAMEALIPALERFPDSWLVRYNLACYCCRLNQAEEGFKYLEQACRLGDVGHIKNLALNDSDLAIIRDRISSVSQTGYV
jgi:predicted Zn-dependent protease